MTCVYTYEGKKHCIQFCPREKKCLGIVKLMPMCFTLKISVLVKQEGLRLKLSALSLWSWNAFSCIVVSASLNEKIFQTYIDDVSVKSIMTFVMAALILPSFIAFVYMSANSPSLFLASHLSHCPLTLQTPDTIYLLLRDSDQQHSCPCLLHSLPQITIQLTISPEYYAIHSLIQGPALWKLCILAILFQGQSESEYFNNR